jgi:hypothetical protein
MAWERRGGDFYYYQSERENGRVRKKYIGRGELAHLIAHSAQTRRSVREERRAKERAELERIKDLSAVGDELYEAAEALARAELIAAGYHRHKGEWRLRRDA